MLKNNGSFQGIFTGTGSVNPIVREVIGVLVRATFIHLVATHNTTHRGI